ncbi:MAG: PASTA domain-containing protein [Bifidobacteriaceae bacterium]|nr:PASTA domain-containing protein [Bifidobacteriaceae bacterium]
MNEALQTPENMLIDQRYRIVSKIAEGGMATVYKAIDERLDRTVAIKILHTQLSQSTHREQFIERFKREAKSAAAIANSHVVQVYDTGEYEGYDYLVMEYVHGVNLRYEINQNHTFSVRETIRIISEILSGLEAAHNLNIVHRDIKPENILINERGHVQITDFGLAKAVSQATLSTTGMLLGTASYLAPETIENNIATAQGDLYSVGIIAWEMLTGGIPFASDNPVTVVFKHVHEDVPSVQTVCTEINPSIADFIAQLTSRNAQLWPENASEALQELQQISANLTVKDFSYQYFAENSTLLSAVPHGIAQTQALAKDISANTHDSNSQNNGETDDETVAIPISNSDSLSENQSQYDERTQLISNNGIQLTQAIPTATGDNSDNSMRTEVISAVADNAHDSRSDIENQSDKKKRSRAKKIVATVIIMILLLSGAGAGAWWYFLGPGSYWTMPNPAELICKQNTACTITNVPWSSYKSTLDVAGIPYTVSEDYSDTVAQGKIISTNPATVGAHVSKRSQQKVQVVVSKGVKQATIPSDIKDSQSENGKNPLQALKNAGFSNVTHDEAHDEYSLDIPSGALLTISQEPGTTLNHNESISITLSKGLMPVKMPDIVGKSKEEAQQALDSLHLQANYTEEFSDTVNAGDVISTQQKAGTDLHWKDTVNVVISKGPQTVLLPDVRGQSTSTAKKTLEDLGFKVNITAPLGDWMHVVRLQSPDPNQQVRLRDTSGNPTVITLTVV